MRVRKSCHKSQLYVWSGTRVYHTRRRGASISQSYRLVSCYLISYICICWIICCRDDVNLIFFIQLEVNPVQRTRRTCPLLLWRKRWALSRRVDVVQPPMDSNPAWGSIPDREGNSTLSRVILSWRTVRGKGIDGIYTSAGDSEVPYFPWELFLGIVLWRELYRLKNLLLQALVWRERLGNYCSARIL